VEIPAARALAMRTLHLYLTRQILATLVMTVTVFTFVLVLVNVLQEMLRLLINHQATVAGLAEGLGLLIPWVMAFALPMGMLTAALLVFGRVSADQELTAVRASGISLLAWITPILLLSLLLCGVSAWINLEVAPRSRTAYKSLLDRMKVKMAESALPEGRFVYFPATKNDPAYIFFAGGSDGANLRNVDVSTLEFDPKVDKYPRIKEEIKAPGATVEVTNREIILHLTNVVIIDHDGQPKSLGYIEKGLSLPASGLDDKPSISDMTFSQLRAQLRELDSMFSVPNDPAATTDQMRERLNQLTRQKRDLTMPVQVQLHRQVALSFACLGFTLVGIPLGIRAHRRETNMGVMMALGLVLIYYSFIVLGQSLQNHANLAPYLIVWVPNFIFQVVGGVMLWRANNRV